MIITHDEIAVYKYLTSKQDGSFNLERHDRENPLSTDRALLSCSYQSKQTGRIFVGGQGGKISEIQISDVDNKNAIRTSFIKSIISGKSTLKKIDQTQTVIDKFISSFYESSKDRAKMVVDIAEHQSSNTIFVAV